MIRLLSVVAVVILALEASAYTFREEAIRAHMSFLASDLLEGRAAGTRGYDIAAQYVAAQFEAAGVMPGANGGYFQRVAFRQTLPQEESSLTIVTPEGEPVTLRFGDGFVTTGDPLHEVKTVSAPVVLVGYGITAPELKHDDYAGVDVRGKIVAYFTGAPAKFPNNLRAHYASSANKLENAAAHGAAGVLTLSTDTDSERHPWPRVIRQHRSGGMHWIEREGAPHAVSPVVSSTITIGPKARDLLFAPRPFDEIVAELRKGTLRPFQLPARVSYRLVSRHQRLQSANVIGMIRGSDALLRDQYLVYTSHLDHVGITEPLDGDSINNGAMDNASGIAALLEIARAFAAQPVPPRRSILFIATTAEEKGLRGADYFAKNPTVPPGSIVANINMDEVMMLHAVKDIVPLGIEVSELGAMARRVAAQMGLEVSPDPYPEEVFFVRSDQYPFIKQGIPAIYVGMGYKARDPRIDSKKEQDRWISTTYHTPQDDLNQKLDYSMGSLLAEFNYRLGLEAANRDAPPAWTPGDFFGERFGRKRMQTGAGASSKQ